MTRMCERWLVMWLRLVAPAHWTDSMLGDLIEDSGGDPNGPDGAERRRRLWALFRVSVRLSVERARQSFVPVRRWTDEPPARRGDSQVRQIWRDTGIAVRSWKRTPAAGLAVVATLAIGIGANAAVFSVVNGVLWRPLVYASPGDLVALSLAITDEPGGGAVSSSQYAAWSERGDLFAETAAYQAESWTIAAADQPDRPWSVRGVRTSPSLLDLLGSRPIRGRWMTSDDAEFDASPVVVVSSRLWQGRLGGSPSVIGSELLLDNRRHRIVGVMPPEFDFPGEADAWVAINPLGTRLRGLRLEFAFLSVVARLNKGVTAEHASAALLPTVIDDGRGGRVVTTRLLDAMVRPVRPMVLLAAGAVALVLLIACANVASLLVVRASSRRRELAIRRALGAGRASLIREALIESSLLSLVGGGLGLAVTWLLMPLLRTMLPPDFPRAASIGVDHEVLAFSAGLCVMTSILFGISATLVRLRAAPLLALKDSGRGVLALGGRRPGLRGWMVALQMALCVVLLSATSLLLASFIRLTTVDRGFRMDGVQVATVMPVRSGAGGDVRLALGDVVHRLRTRPGIEAVAVTDNLPLDDFGLDVEFLVDGQNPTPRPRARVVSIGTGFFDALGVHVVQGRMLTDEEVSVQAPVAVVSEILAKQYLGAAPLGRFLIVGTRPYEVVGIAADLRTGLNALDVGPTLYRPIDSGVHNLEQGAQFVTPTHILVRGNDAEALTSAVREVVGQAGALHLLDLTALETRLWGATAGPRFYAMVFSLFAGAGMVLVAVGIYGLTTHVVAAGTHEIAVRLALGADRSGVIGLVLRRGLTAAAIGGTCGLVLAALASPVIGGLLVGISPLEPRVYLWVVCVTTVTMSIACISPALSASRISPMTALKDD